MNKYLHPLGWLAFFLYGISEDVVNKSLTWFGLSLNLTFLIAMAACFYFFYLFVWDRVIRDRQPWFLALFLPLGVLIFICTRFLLEEVVLREITGFGNYRDPYNIGYILDNAFRPISIILLSLVAWLLNRQSELKEKRAILEREKTEAELGFLRAQINPHFLFNTLGFIQSRVFKADAEAAEITTELAFILRKAFASSEQKLNSLKDEMEIVQSIYGIMKKRFNGKCFVDFDVDESLLSINLEPLLLMPLAENMFKHGDLRSENNPGRISVQRKDDQLQVIFENRIMSGTPHEGSGIGLDNTRKRLNLAYPSNHKFEVRQDSDNFTVQLNLSGVC